MEVLQQIIIMVLLILVGLVCYKIKLIKQESLYLLSELVIKVANPALIFNSFQIPRKEGQFGDLLYSFGLAVLVSILSIVISTLFIQNKDKSKRSIERFAGAYSNCAFIGIPLIQGVYGQEGVFFLAAFIAVFNVLVWTHGVLTVKGSFSLHSFGEAMFSPSVVAIVLGLVFYGFRLELPYVLEQTVNYLGGLLVPLAMITAGAVIAQSDLLKIFRKKRIYYITFVRAILIPLLVLGAFFLLPKNEIVMGVNLIASGCPVATLVVLLSVRYEKDAVYASEVYTVSTLFSVISLPLLMLLMNFALFGTA